MPTTSYDAIVIGARCAGSPAAMLLARKGRKVLLVDRATFPSDTISTHLVHPPGVSALARWSLLDRLIATGCPPIHTYVLDFGPFAFQGAPGKPDAPVSYGPRRTVLDKLLVDAAAESGVEVREGFVVDEIVMDGGRVSGIRGRGPDGRTVTEQARVVIGADGLHSTLARAVKPEHYREQPPLQAGYYTYFSGLPTKGRFEAYDRFGRAWAAWPTHDDLTLVVLSWPYAEFEANRHDVETHFMKSLERAPAFHERVRAAKREDRFYGAAVPNFFRKPFGPGWALVGDAGYNKDFITAQGISDAFRDAERLSVAIDEWLSGARDFDSALESYRADRDRHVLPIYGFTCQFARLEPPPPETLELFKAVHGNPEAMEGFVQVISGVVSPADFFAEDNVRRIFAMAH